MKSITENSCRSCEEHDSLLLLLLVLQHTQETVFSLIPASWMTHIRTKTVCRLTRGACDAEGENQTDQDVPRKETG